jgi:hypothetical protein
VIALGKDLQADILPPPEYILEAYALAMEILDVEKEEHRERIIAKGQQLKDDFETRLAFWEKTCRIRRCSGCCLRRLHRQLVISLTFEILNFFQL